MKCVVELNTLQTKMSQNFDQLSIIVHYPTLVLQRHYFTKYYNLLNRLNSSLGKTKIQSDMYTE